MRKSIDDLIRRARLDDQNKRGMNPRSGSNLVFSNEYMDAIIFEVSAEEWDEMLSLRYKTGDEL